MSENINYEYFLEHLNKREGRENEVYEDSLGKPTVGVGHLVTPEDNLQVGDVVSDDQIEDFLAKDGVSAYENAKEKAAQLGRPEDAELIHTLAGMNFQLGNNWEQIHKKTWQHMRDNNWEAASAEMEDSKWFRQTPVRVKDAQEGLAGVGGEGEDFFTTETSQSPTVESASDFDQLEDALSVPASAPINDAQSFDDLENALTSTDDAKSLNDLEIALSAESDNESDPEWIIPQKVITKYNEMSKDEMDEFVSDMAFWDTTRGIKQLIGFDSPEMQEEAQLLSYIFREDPKQLARFIAWSFADPIQLTLMAAPIPGTRVVGGAMKAARLGRFANLAKIAHRAGVASSMGYVDATAPGLISDKQSRVENYALGAIGGGAAGPLIQGVGIGAKKVAPKALTNMLRNGTSRLEEMYLGRVGRKAWETIEKNPLETIGAIGGGALGAGLSEDNDLLAGTVGALAGAGGARSLKRMRGLSPTVAAGAEDLSKAAPPGSIRGIISDSIGAREGDTMYDTVGRVVIDNFNLPEEYVHLKRGSQNELAENIQGMSDFVETNLGRISKEDDKLLYRMLTGDTDNISADEIKHLEGIKDEARERVTALSQMLVDAGLLSKKKFEENVDRYLTRSYYTKHSAKSAARGKAYKNGRLVANELRARGVHEDVSKAELEQLIRDGQVTNAVRYSEGFPGVKTLDNPSGKFDIMGFRNGKYKIRRQLTEYEREQLGEIDKASIALMKTAHSLMGTAGRFKFYDDLSRMEQFVSSKPVDGWVHVKPRAVDGVLVPQDGASKGLRGAGPKPSGKLDKMGNLSGKYVHPEVYGDLMRMERLDGIANHPAFRNYRKLNQAWKTTKTIYNPTVHMNNMMSNVAMYDLSGGDGRLMGKALNSMLKKDDIYKEARAAGAFSGGHNDNELNEMVFRAMRDNNVLKDRDIAPAVGKAVDLTQSFLKKAKDGAFASHDKITRLYQAEDEVFRMGLYMTGRQRGMTKEQAGAYARKHMIDYEINAPGAQLLRHTALPFFAYTYRATPLLLESMVKRPWKAAKWIGAYALMNRMGEIEQEQKGVDMDLARSMMTEQEGRGHYGMSERLLPTQLALPGTDQFLNTTRWAPASDIFGGENKGFFGWLPEPLQPSFGSAGSAASIMLGRDPFTGKDIPGKETEPVTSRLKGLVREMIPNLPTTMPVPGIDHLQEIFGPSIGIPLPEDMKTYATRKIEKAVLDPDRLRSYEDRLDTTAALLSVIGIKLRPVDLRTLEARRRMEGKRTVEGITKSMAVNKRLYLRGSISRDELEERNKDYTDQLMEAREELIRDLQGKRFDTND